MLFCPGCGFGFWHNWGVLSGMRPTKSMVTVSGSSLAAVCYINRLSFRRELSRCHAMRSSFRRRPKRTVREWLNVSLPSDCAHRCRGRVRILARRFPQGTVVAFDEWESKEDLIECLLASVSILQIHKYRGHYYTDCVWYRTHFATIPSKTVRHVPDVQTATSDFLAGFERGRRQWKLGR